MPDVIRTMSPAQSLVEQLAATVPPYATARRVTADGWIPEVVMGDVRETMDAEKSAARFLVEAVDWNMEFLYLLQRRETDLSREAREIAGVALHWAWDAAADPRSPRCEGDESPAESLAYLALTCETLEPDNWRECDRAAALDVLPAVDAWTRAHPDESLTRRRDVEQARIDLLMFEPAMPDRRPTRESDEPR